MDGKDRAAAAGNAADATPQPDLRTLGWHCRFGQQYLALLYKNGETQY